MTSNGQHDPSFSEPGELGDSNGVISEILHEALAEVIAERDTQWQRQLALIEAQAEAEVAKLRAIIVELRAQFADLVTQRLEAVEAKVEARLAQLRDGAPGPQGMPGADGQIGPQGDAGPQGEAGHVELCP